MYSFVLYVNSDVLNYQLLDTESHFLLSLPMLIHAHYAATAATKVLQSCPTLCDPIDRSPPGSSVPWILQARMLEWVAISFSNACMHAKSLQSCPTLCDPIDRSPSGSSVPGILQARMLEWVVISFSNACMLSLFSRVQLFATLWTAAHQAPPSTGFSRQEY